MDDDDLILAAGLAAMGHDEHMAAHGWPPYDPQTVVDTNALLARFRAKALAKFTADFWERCPDGKLMLEFVEGRRLFTSRQSWLFIAAVLRRIGGADLTRDISVVEELADSSLAVHNHWTPYSRALYRFAIDYLVYQVYRIRPQQLQSGPQLYGLIAAKIVNDASILEPFVDCLLGKTRYRSGSQGEAFQQYCTTTEIRRLFGNNPAHHTAPARFRFADDGLEFTNTALQSNADIMRDLVPNPFNHSLHTRLSEIPVSVAARALMLGIYDNNDYGSLPVLADALEEGGCTDPVILGHARNGQQHFKGCWLIEGLLACRS